MTTRQQTRINTSSLVKKSGDDMVKVGKSLWLRRYLSFLSCFNWRLLCYCWIRTLDLVLAKFEVVDHLQTFTFTEQEIDNFCYPPSHPGYFWYVLFLQATVFNVTQVQRTRSCSTFVQTQQLNTEPSDWNWMRIRLLRGKEWKHH